MFTPWGVIPKNIEQATVGPSRPTCWLPPPPFPPVSAPVTLVFKTQRAASYLREAFRIIRVSQDGTLQLPCGMQPGLKDATSTECHSSKMPFAHAHALGQLLTRPHAGERPSTRFHVMCFLSERVTRESTEPRCGRIAELTLRKSPRPCNLLVIATVPHVHRHWPTAVAFHALHPYATSRHQV